MPRAILFQWTGWAPGKRSKQVSCAAVFESKAAFMRACNRRESEMPYVSIDNRAPERESQGNTGARLAVENPGVVYWQDTINHTPREDVWLVHPNPELA